MSILSLFVATLSAQEIADTMYISLSRGRVVKYAVAEIQSFGFEPMAAPEFPTADNSQVLNVGNPAASARTLLDLAGTECTDTMGRAVITNAEYAEIKTAIILPLVPSF